MLPAFRTQFQNVAKLDEQADRSMEQYPPSNPAITWWLADYTHFICDQLGLPHEQGDQLFQHYHWLTTGIPPPQPASSQYGYPTAYPEIPDSHYPSPLQEQSPSAVFEDGLRSSPMSNSGFLNLSHGHFLEEEINYLADHTAMTASKIAPSELFSPYDQQPSQINSDSDFPETISPSMHSIGPSTHTPIGSVADYDPLWVQHCNINPNRVNNHRTSMKFDTLFTHNVLKLGDILTFQVAITTNRHTIQTEAHLQVPSPSPPLITTTLLTRADNKQFQSPPPLRLLPRPNHHPPQRPPRPLPPRKKLQRHNSHNRPPRKNLQNHRRRLRLAVHPSHPQRAGAREPALFHKGVSPVARLEGSRGARDGAVFSSAAGAAGTGCGEPGRAS